jgi:hypothetical protein
VEGNGRDFGVVGVAPDLEDERGGESDMGTFDVREQQLMGVEGIRGEEHAIGGDAQKALGAFQDGWTGVAAFGWTVANDEAGEVAFDQVLIEISEELAQALVSPTFLM